MSLWRYNFNPKTGNLNTVLAGVTTGGNALLTGDNSRQKVRNLSCLVTVDCETDTLTMAFLWQVSNDNSTWVDVSNGSQNAAAVVFATGTAGADANVTKMFPAPDSVYGWKYVRGAIVTGVATGNTADTYSIGYCFRGGAQ